MSLDAVERQGMPFRGESGGVGAGQGPVGTGQGPVGTGQEPVGTGQGMGDVSGRVRFDVPSEADELAARVRQAREEAARHDEADHRPRAPRPEKMQR
jgi:hypothetical protein